MVQLELITTFLNVMVTLNIKKIIIRTTLNTQPIYSSTIFIE